MPSRRSLASKPRFPHARATAPHGPRFALRNVWYRAVWCAPLVLLAACSADRAGGLRPEPPRTPGQPVTAWQVAGAGWGVPALDATSAYFLEPGHTLVAVDRATGVLRWRAPLSTGASQPPGFTAIVAGPVVAAVDNGAVYAIGRAGTESAGTRRWVFLPPDGLAAEDWIDGDSATVYVGTTAGRLFALDAASGAQRWAVQLSAEPGAIAMGPRRHGATVYVGLKRPGSPSTGGVVAVDATRGTVRWSRPFPPSSAARGGGCAGQVTATRDGTIVGVAEDGIVYALDPRDGAVRWTAGSLTGVPAGLGGDPALDQRPVLALDDRVLVGSTTGLVLSLDAATGAERWRTRADYGSAVFPIVARDGRAWLTHFGGQLVAFDVGTGAVLWVTGQRDGLGRYAHAPVYDAEQLFISGRDGKYALTLTR